MRRKSASRAAFRLRMSASRDASLRKTVPRRAGNVSRDSAIAATARWWRTLTTASQSRSSRRFEKLSPNSEEDTRLIQQVKPAQAIASILACPSTPRKDTEPSHLHAPLLYEP